MVNTEVEGWGGSIADLRSASEARRARLRLTREPLPPPCVFDPTALSPANFEQLGQLLLPPPLGPSSPGEGPSSDLFEKTQRSGKADWEDHAGSDGRTRRDQITVRERPENDDASPEVEEDEMGRPGDMLTGQREGRPEDDDEVNEDDGKDDEDRGKKEEKEESAISEEEDMSAAGAIICKDLILHPIQVCIEPPP